MGQTSEFAASSLIVRQAASSRKGLAACLMPAHLLWMDSLLGGNYADITRLHQHDEGCHWY